MIDTAPITETLIDEAKRLNFLHKHLGKCAPSFEGLVYPIMSQASNLYSGGLWEFVELSNGGFYMYPDARETWTMKWDDNYFEGEMSTQAAGIGVSLMALSWRAFSEPNGHCSEKFHLLRDYALDHKEASQIFGFID